LPRENTFAHSRTVVDEQDARTLAKQIDVCSTRAGSAAAPVNEVPTPAPNAAIVRNVTKNATHVIGTVSVQKCRKQNISSRRCRVRLFQWRTHQLFSHELAILLLLENVMVALHSRAYGA